MVVLITGITGFIGSHLGRRLVESGAEVYAIVRPGSSRGRIGDYDDRVHIIEADLREPASYRDRLRELRPTLTFHLAWYAEHGRFWTAPENLECVSMTLRLARELAEMGGRRLVAVGSCAEYTWDRGLLSEAESPTEPDSVYGAAKNATRIVLEAYGREVGLGVSWARLFFPFGPGEGEARLVPAVTRSFLRGEPVRCSHGNQLRDFIYVEDCVDALRAIAACGLAGCVNVGTGEPTRIRDVVERLSALTGRSLRDVTFDPTCGSEEPPMILADPRKLVEATGWRPARTLEQALAETVEWWRKRL
jgi:nucleoside-diphosphate-sugar epimerase